MPRKPRLFIPGRYYHIMLRGNNGNKIFHEDADCCRLSLLLQEGIARFGHRIHAFCFMPNHIHLVLQASDFPVSKIIHNFSFRYSHFFNRKNEKKGHVFQGRYKSILLDAQGYLKRLVRYVHSNPVRAGLVSHLEEYRWTSHLDYLNDSKGHFHWVTTNEVLSHFGETYDHARKQYLSFHHQDIEDLKDEKLFSKGNYQGTILGDEEFVSKINCAHSQETTLEEVPLSVAVEQACSFFSVTLEDVQSSGKSRSMSYIRAILATLVNKNPQWTLKELSQLLNRDATSLSELYRNRERNPTNRFSKDVGDIEESLIQLP